MKLHAIASAGKYVVTAHFVYLENDAHTWRKEITRKVKSTAVSTKGKSTKGTDKTVSLHISAVEAHVDNYVVAVYEANWYIGKVADTDSDEIEVSFMERKKQMYQ